MTQGQYYIHGHPGSPDRRKEMYADMPHAPQPKVQQPKRPNGRTGTKVICLETGEVFISAQAASRAKGISYKTVLRKAEIGEGWDYVIGN